MNYSIGRLAALGLALGLGACSDDPTDTPKDGVDTDGDTDNGGVTCTSSVKPVLPATATGATDVYYRTPLVVSFTADEHDTASFALVTSDGTAVPLDAPSWSSDGKQATITASGPLEPSTAYTLQVTFSCTTDATTDITFTTSATGAAVDDPSLFLDNTYVVDLSTATIIEPAGVNSLLGGLLGDVSQSIAVVPTDLTDGKISFFGGLVDGGVQDLCQTTIEFPEPADFEDPFFSISAPDGIDLSFSGVSISLLELSLSGSFNPDASAIEGLTLAGSIDTRSLIGILGDTLGGATGDDAVCNLLGTFTNGSVGCEDCPDGTGKFCLSLVAANIVADVDSDLVLVPRTQEDIDADTETCPPEEPAPAVR